MRVVFDGDIKRILSEIEKMAEKGKQLSKKRQSNRRGFIEGLIEWVAVKPIAFRSTNHPLFREMV
jgi:hypothetical protein